MHTMSQEVSEITLDRMLAVQDQIFFGKQKIPSRENIRDFIVSSTIKYLPKSPFVDVACGYRTSEPEVSRALGKIEKYVAFDLVDLSDQVEDISAIQNLRADVRNIPLEANSVNTAICIEALEHISDDRRALEEIRRILQKDGLLFLTVPGIDVPKHEKSYQKDYGRYSSDELTSLLEQSNFKVIEFEEKFFSAKHINTLVVARQSEPSRG